MDKCSHEMQLRIRHDVSSMTEAFTGRFTGRSAVWLARLLWEQEVGSSNLPAPTGLTTTQNENDAGFDAKTVSTRVV